MVSTHLELDGKLKFSLRVHQILPNKNVVKILNFNQYMLVDGKYPQNKNNGFLQSKLIYKLFKYNTMLYYNSSRDLNKDYILRKMLIPII